MITINIAADAKYPVDRKGIRRRLTEVLAKQRLTDNVEISVIVMGKRKMTHLHVDYLSLPGPTDVLSFPQVDPGDSRPFVGSPDGVLRLGDIAICYPVARDTALVKQVKVDQEVEFLAEHGLMHLLGYHHD